MTLSNEQRLSLLESARSYAEQAQDSPLADYLARRRGITDPALIKRLGLGYVGEPFPGHERFRGRMAIPYLRYGYSGPNVATIRFACMVPSCKHTDHEKMLSLPGHGNRLYNTRDLLAPVDEVCICEGEWDTMTALAYGLHAVGVPGVKAWKPYMAGAFAGYKKVRIIAQMDDDGQSVKWANELASQIPAAVVQHCPHGLDLNDAHLAGRANALLKGPKAVPAGV